MSNRVPEEVIEQIRSTADIVDIVGEYVQLTKRGRNWFGLCPFHGESTPSFSVTSDKQIFHCFGCGAGGNVITFLMDIENITFQDALARLGSRTGIEVEVNTNASSEASSGLSKSDQQLIKMHEFAADMYHHILLNTEEGQAALDYLENRGFTREMIEKFRIGWALPEWNYMATALQRKGYSEEELAASGLVIQREQGNGYFDRFRGRIIFPITNENGKVIAFSGRILENTKQEAKYMNSPESPIFQKSQVLYNVHQARNAIRKNRKIVLFEGFMDVIAAGKAGVDNALATMGTSLTSQHIRAMKRFAQDVVICFDGDDAGWEAAKRAAIALNEENFKVEVAVLPGKMDPDDYVREHGNDAFRDQIIGKPHAFIAFAMMHARRHKNFQYENDLLQYVQEVLQLLAGRSSPIERDLYIKQLSNETGLSEEAILQQYRKLENKSIERSRPERVAKTVKREPKRVTSLHRAERLLFSHALADRGVMRKLAEVPSGMPFISEEFKALYVQLLGFYEEWDKADFHKFLETLQDAELRKLVLETTLSERDPEHGDEEIADCLKHLEKHRVEQQISLKIQQSKEAEKQHDIKRALLLAQEVIALRKSL
ncbi:DNA primase [Planococcus shenhongbingii]|uniref:DNA primase n=1 Tax=Planococcus shenhongbingii TaxID=3058398 RepID=A0ABT8ND14_9BACL|nr:MULTISPECIES: DNA primase [unclassified Planococcus (in: firmicutes)]MDN7245788.1 DNA primase [Planococcus sp. N017]WKA60098.1 DNA primase [Planococcus sp. N016]